MIYWCLNDHIAAVLAGNVSRPRAGPAASTLPPQDQELLRKLASYCLANIPNEEQLQVIRSTAPMNLTLASLALLHGDWTAYEREMLCLFVSQYIV